MIFHPMRIAGYSLYPRYQEGDFVIVSKIPLLLRGPRPGDVVVFRHPTKGELIKIVEHMEPAGDTLFVIGLSADSHDSRAFGPIARQAVLGKVIFHIPRSWRH